LKAVVRPLRSLAADWGLEAVALYHDCARRPRQRDRDYFTKRATADTLARCSKVLEAALPNAPREGRAVARTLDAVVGKQIGGTDHERE